MGAEAVEAARATATYDHNAIPLATLERQLDNGLTPFELRQWIGNAVRLLPLGLYGPMLTPRLASLGAILMLAVAVSVVIEVGQLLAATAYGFPVRVADVDDLLLNTLGAAVGYLGWRVATITTDFPDDAVRRPAD